MRIFHLQPIRLMVIPGMSACAICMYTKSSLLGILQKLQKLADTCGQAACLTSGKLQLHTRPIIFYCPFGPVAKPPHLHFGVCNSCFLIRALLSPGLLYFSFFGTMLYFKKKKSQLRTICTFRSRTKSEFFLLIHLNLDLMDFLPCRGILELSALPNFQLARNIE